MASPLSEYKLRFSFYAGIYENMTTPATRMGVLPGANNIWRIESKMMDWFGDSVNLIKIHNNKEFVMLKVKNGQYQVVDNSLSKANNHILTLVDSHMRDEYGIMPF